MQNRTLFNLVWASISSIVSVNNISSINNISISASCIELTWVALIRSCLTILETIYTVINAKKNEDREVGLWKSYNGATTRAPVRAKKLNKFSEEKKIEVSYIIWKRESCAIQNGKAIIYQSLKCNSPQIRSEPKQKNFFLCFNFCACSCNFSLSPQSTSSQSSVDAIAPQKNS